MGQVEQLGDRRHPRDVGQVEAPAQPALDLDRPPRGGDARRDAGVEPADRLGPDLGGGVDGEPERAGLAHQAAAELVVEVGGARRVGALVGRPGEEAPLGREVVLDVGVVVEVVAGEVGEQGRREARAGHAPLHQRVRGDLHGAGRVARVAHPGEQQLEVDRVGRGVVHRLHRPADPGLDRADQAAAVAGRLEHRAQQERRGGLAVGAGDADDGQRLGGAPGERRGGEGHAEARVAHHDLGRPEPRQGPLHHRRGGPARDGLGGEVVAVGAQPRQRAEERARARVGGAVDDRGDDGVGGGGVRGHEAPSGTAADQLLEGHAGRDSTTGPRRAYGRILMFCRENSVICSKAGAATSPP